MPGAWETIQVRRNRVLVITISTPDYKITEAWANRSKHLELPPASDSGYLTGLPFGPNRNMALQMALDGGYGYLFFLDADTLVPNNCVTRLIEAKRDIVGALYYQRFPPYNAAAANGEVTDGKLQRKELEKIPFGDIIPVRFLPTGATLYSRRVLEAMYKKFPKPFEFTLDLDPERKVKHLVGLSEDFSFCLKAEGLGYQSWLHTGVLAYHEVLMMVGPRGPQPLEMNV